MQRLQEHERNKKYFPRHKYTMTD